MVLEPSAGRCTEGQEKAHYLLKSDTAHVIYSWDSPGWKVASSLTITITITSSSSSSPSSSLLHLSAGLVPLGDTSEPKFSWEIELGSNTVINYGCYANRQRYSILTVASAVHMSSHPLTCTLRNILQKFFFPNDYTERPASSTPQAGEKRIYTSMDVSVRLTSRGAFTIPFHDNKGVCLLTLCHTSPTTTPPHSFLPNHSLPSPFLPPPPFLPPLYHSLYRSFPVSQILHQIGLSLGEGSEVMVHQPWTTNQNGYTTVVTGTLHNIVVTSDLSYPHLANAAAIHVSVSYHLPLLFLHHFCPSPSLFLPPSLLPLSCPPPSQLFFLSLSSPQLDVDLHFPRVWNATQRWDMRLTGSEVEVGILFYYVDFVNGQSWQT